MTDDKTQIDTSKILQERIKELNCIYGISTLIQDQSLDVDETLTKSLILIKNAWQYPEITCVRIKTRTKTYSTDNFMETKWKQTASIAFRKNKIGDVEVFYLEEKPEISAGPFLIEERRLLNAVADLLSTYLEKQDINVKLNGFETKAINGEKNDWEIILELLVKTDPRGALRITRRMIYYLYRIQNEEITALLANVCPIDSNDAEWCGINIPNPKENSMELQKIQKQVFEIAKRAIPKEQVSDLFQTWLKSDKGRPLLIASQRQGISLGDMTGEINRYWDIPEDARTLMPEDERAIGAGLIRRFFSGRLKYLNVAKDYIKLSDFVDLTKRIVGPLHGEGKLGGKSSGLFLAQKIVEVEKKRIKDLENIKTPKSWYVSSDSMMHLIRYNDLDDLINIKYLDPTEIRQEQSFLEQLFKNSVFPPDIVTGLKSILLDVGDCPIIVRSSSLLEDSFEAAFSGKYKSLFLVNTGTLDERLANLMNAIAEIYASVFAPSPLEYRRERGLLEFSEEMSILIQEVVGTRVGPYFMPAYAGVSLSNNEFRWSPRIRREDGMIRLVAGLGTRAVDRVGDDYPVLIAPFRPE
ncbi:MAG: PEP/pyruvate-binding domain-containing protein, partial [Thermoplasmata archaeon]|nr:PEP/pyruvate-binding domain-containing protein [Thermoplasmata archaeon]